MTHDSFQQRIETMLDAVKFGKRTSVPRWLKNVLPNGLQVQIKPITERTIAKQDTIKWLAAWRDAANIWFPAQFPVTYEGTAKWAKEQLLDKKDRILFFLYAGDRKKPFGHIGLYRIDYKKKSVELDNIIRGVKSKDSKGGISAGLSALIDWTQKHLGIQTIHLRVFSDNEAAMRLYQRLGFVEVDRVPLVKEVRNGITSWVESEYVHNPKRYFVQMKLKNQPHKKHE